MEGSVCEYKICNYGTAANYAVSGPRLLANTILSKFSLFDNYLFLSLFLICSWALLTATLNSSKSNVPSLSLSEESMYLISSCSYKHKNLSHIKYNLANSPSSYQPQTVCRDTCKQVSAPENNILCHPLLHSASTVLVIFSSWSISTFLKTCRRSESEILSFSLFFRTLQPASLISAIIYCTDGGCTKG